ncbi:hypothetical protein OIB37_36170 [Streptomyces sp. NBC_00820]|uniref:hypothetical protein n=1 Tax=Streptomyces sp. NBC_00820 TaxID=2975842 RepID=UPI002ED32503|nr:hypothetical protein OIB37_00030 [Streptomyces sp. NBC_00820]WTI18112.1 hypothetical protein OIB37_36170 [Streptomyces sp. NBC_00820]
MTSTHPRKRPQRRSEIPHGPQQDTGLQQIRDALPPAPAPCTVEPAPGPVGEEVPPELLALVTHHCRRINAYLARAQHLQTLHGDNMKQWQRLVLYALTDALAHNHLLVGTLAAYLQRQDLDTDLLRRYLQSPDPDRYITGEAVQHLDGLTGAVPEDSPEPVWMAVGRHIARDGRFS